MAQPVHKLTSGADGIVTPLHPGWTHLLLMLSSMFNPIEELGDKEYRCRHDSTLPITRRILDRSGFDGKASVEFLRRELGASCDCYLLEFGADAAKQWLLRVGLNIVAWMTTYCLPAALNKGNPCQR